MSQPSFGESGFTWESPSHKPGWGGSLRRIERAPKRKAQTRWEMEPANERGPQSSVTLSDDYHSGAHPLPPYLGRVTRAPQVPPASWGLRTGGPGICKEKVCAPSGGFPRQTVERSSGRSCGNQRGHVRLKDPREAEKSPWVGRCPPKVRGCWPTAWRVQAGHLGAKPTFDHLG